MDRARAESVLQALIKYIKGEMKGRSWALISISDKDLEALNYAAARLKEGNAACDQPGGGQEG